MTMKKEGIQTRNRKMSTKSKKKKHPSSGLNCTSLNAMHDGISNPRGGSATVFNSRHPYVSCFPTASSASSAQHLQQSSYMLHSAIGGNASSFGSASHAFSHNSINGGIIGGGGIFPADAGRLNPVGNPLYMHGSGRFGPFPGLSSHPAPGLNLSTNSGMIGAMA